MLQFYLGNHMHSSRASITRPFRPRESNASRFRDKRRNRVGKGETRLYKEKGETRFAVLGLVATLLNQRFGVPDWHSGCRSLALGSRRGFCDSELCALIQRRAQLTGPFQRCWSISREA